MILSAEKEKLKELEKADAKEIGSYRKRTGLRGDFRIQQDKIIEQMDRIDELERVSTEQTAVLPETDIQKDTQSGDDCTQNGNKNG